MYKIIKQAFIVIFFALIFIPVLLSDKTGGAKSETENRYLAKMPSIKELSIGSFNNWLNDNIAFRQDIIGIKGYIEYHFLHKSPTDKVIFGKDGFMFYTWDDNIAIAQNKYPLSEIELRKSIKNLRLANDILAKIISKKRFRQCTTILISTLQRLLTGTGKHSLTPDMNLIRNTVLL